MLLANNGVRGVSRILLEFTEDHSDNPTYLFERISETENLVKWLWKTNHPDAIQILILGVIGKKKHLEYLSKASQKHPAAAIAAYATLLAIHEDKEWRKALVKLITATPELVCDVIPRVNAKAAGILSECRPQSVAEECEYATVDMLPELLVSPPWMTKEKRKIRLCLIFQCFQFLLFLMSLQRLPKTDPYLPCHPLPANSPTAGDKTNIVYRPAADQKSKLGETLNTAYTGATNTVASWF